MDCYLSPDWITAMVALLGGGAALWQYWRAQEWKRAEWVAADVKEWLREPEVRNCLLMLDWQERKLPLLVADGTWTTTFVYREEMLLHALSSPTSPQQQDYTDEEVSIRDSFDRFFGGLERFEDFRERGLVSVRDLKPYLRYWVEILADSRNIQKSAAVRTRLWAYVNDYGFEGTQRLARAFGHAMESGA